MYNVPSFIFYVAPEKKLWRNNYAGAFFHYPHDSNQTNFLSVGSSGLLRSSGRYASNTFHIFHSPGWSSFIYNSLHLFTMGFENWICDYHTRCGLESIQASTTCWRERARWMDNTNSCPFAIAEDPKIKCDKREAIASKKRS